MTHGTAPKKTRVVLRKTDEGEVLALLPDCPGDPRGEFCVGYSQVGKESPCDPDAVIAASVPATEAEAYRLLTKLSDEPYVGDFEFWATEPEDSPSIRTADAKTYKQYGRIRYIY